MNIPDRWNSWRLWRRLLFAFACSFAIGVVVILLSYRAGVAADCEALGVKHDGQCGLATFIGLFDGLIGAAIIIGLSLLGTVAQWFWGRRRVGK
jgi:hypothetical protein